MAEGGILNILQVYWSKSCLSQLLIVASHFICLFLFFRVLWGGYHPSWSSKYSCERTEHIQLLLGCPRHPETLLPEWALDCGLARKTSHCRSHIWVQKTLQQTREPYFSWPHQWDTGHWGKIHCSLCFYILLLFSLLVRLYFVGNHKLGHTFLPAGVITGLEPRCTLGIHSEESWWEEETQLHMGHHTIPVLCNLCRRSV